MDFGIKLKELRTQKNLTQLQMAKILDTSKSNISKYETGSVEPNMETLVKISRYFDVSIDYLLNPNNSISHKFMEKNFFFFFFDEESLLRSTFANRIKSAIADMGLSEDDFINLVPIEAERAASFLECKGEPTANDLIELSQFLDTSIDYLLGQIPKLNKEEKKLLNSFVKLDTDRKDIIIGKTKELLLQQEASFVAADEPLKKTGTTNSTK